MKLLISHLTEYEYGLPVTDSVNEIRLTPFTNERQSCFRQTIAVEPSASLFSYEDYFGNRVHSFSVNGLHRRLAIRSQMTVVTRPALDADIIRGRMQPEQEWAMLADDGLQNRFAEYLLPSLYTAPSAGVEAFLDAEQSGWTAEGGEAPRANGVYAWLKRLTGRIKSEFVYDPHATNVQTKVADMMHSRRGVCQDFAHLMLSACRTKGVPARYVSGYHFVGDLQGGNADFEQASHAWVEAYVPGIGWCGFDPTNDEAIGERYVKLAHGRDYKDIVPVKGVYRGTGEQQLKVTVDVRKVEEHVP